jgi:hypothetical protein
VERILADDFLGVAPDGSLYDKEKELTNARENTENFLSNHVNGVKICFFGGTAVVREAKAGSFGAESRSTGNACGPISGSSAVTNGKLLLQEDLLVPDH